MADITNHPKFDLETALYGPGTLSGWYLTFLCALITWCFHPTKNFLKLSLSPDVAFYALYASIAALHMTVLVSRFESEELAVFMRLLGSSYHDWDRGQDSVEKILENIGTRAGIRKMVMGIYVPFEVGVMFLCAVGLGLVGVVAVRCLRPRVRNHRRWRLLPWVLVWSGLLVLGCFCFLSSRCGAGVVFHGMLSCAVGYLCRFIVIGALTCMWSGVIVLLIAPLFGLFFLGTFISWRDVFSSRRVRYAASLTPAANVGNLLRLLIIVPLCFGSLVVVGLFAYHFGVGFIVDYLCLVGAYVAEGWLPDVGVKISAWDQILGLCTGIVAILLTVKGVLTARRKRSRAAPLGIIDGDESGCIFELNRLPRRSDETAVRNQGHELSVFDNGLGSRGTRDEEQGAGSLAKVAWYY